MYSADVKLTDLEQDRLPTPRGYKILVAMPTVEAKTEGGVWRPDQLIKLEETASIFGFVVEMGTLAYKDASKFPDGPWCQQGDWVVFRSYSGTRFKIGGHEFRLINDDTVEAVVDDPRGIERAT
jgi:co-chaperonin GroES (HSP10)